MNQTHQSRVKNGQKIHYGIRGGGEGKEGKTKYEIIIIFLRQKLVHKPNIYMYKW